MPLKSLHFSRIKLGSARPWEQFSFGGRIGQLAVAKPRDSSVFNGTYRLHQGVKAFLNHHNIAAKQFDPAATL